MAKDNAKPSAKNQSAVKTLEIIEVLAEHVEPIRLQDLSAMLKMDSSTVLRFLVSLMLCGYVKQNTDTLKYQLTFKICSVANKISENIHLNEIAQPFMKLIANRLMESVCLAFEQNMSVVYIGVFQLPNQTLRSTQRIGNRAPMHCTGTGKLMLLNHDETYIDKLIAREGLNVYTNNTIASREQLLQELSIVRQQGYSLDREECEIGSNCVAIPIRDFSGKIVAAISATGPATRLTQEKIQENIPFLLKMSHDLSALLGYNGKNYKYTDLL